MRISDKGTASAFVVLGMAACVFLIVLVAGQGVEQASLWATVLGTLTAIMVAVARIWPLTVWRRATEIVIYDSGKSSWLGHDFDGIGGQTYSNGAPYGNMAKAELSYHDGIVSIRRTNNDGTFHVSLIQYSYGDGDDKQVLPANVAIPGSRQLRVSCELRTIDHPHILWFSWREKSSRSGLARDRREVTSKFWTLVDLSFKVDPSKDCYLRIDDYYQTGSIPSEVQIRRIIVAERKVLRLVIVA